MKSVLDELKEYTSTSETFTISRTVSAPRDLVWRVWTEQEHLKNWWGPKGFTMLSCTVDLQPGGQFLYGMKNEQGVEMWGKWVFLEITPPEFFSYILSFSDADGGTTRHFASETWPLHMRCTVNFTEAEGKTTINLTNCAVNATPEESATFNGGRDGMRIGFGSTLDQLDTYLASLI